MVQLRQFVTDFHKAGNVSGRKFSQSRDEFFGLAIEFRCRRLIRCQWRLVIQRFGWGKNSQHKVPCWLLVLRCRLLMTCQQD
jgi:hypothetical protein